MEGVGEWMDHFGINRAFRCVMSKTSVALMGKCIAVLVILSVILLWVCCEVE